MTGYAASEPPAEVGVTRVAGMPFARLTRAQVVDHVFAALERGTGGWLLTANLDYLRQFDSDPSFRALYGSADLVVPDGTPILWASRLQKDPLPERVAGADLVWLLAERAAREGRRLYMLGGALGAAEQARERFLTRWPTLRICGISCPRFSADPTPDELAATVAELDAAEPDLVYIALGAPKEGRVAAALRAARPRAWYVGVGIGLSFAAGSVRRAPAWAQRAGLEWLHRLLQEPRRLGGRYLRDDLPFAFRLWLQSWGARR